MSKLKIGDIVSVVPNKSMNIISIKEDGNCPVTGTVVFIKDNRCNNPSIAIKLDKQDSNFYGAATKGANLIEKGWGGWWYESEITLINPYNPLEDAKRTLEEAGYTVTPPPEPVIKERWIVWYKSKDGVIHSHTYYEEPDGTQDYQEHLRTTYVKEVF